MKPPVLHINPQQIIYYERGNIKNKKNSNNKYRKLIVNYMKFTYIIHIYSIIMFKHWSPDIISFTS